FGNPFEIPRDGNRDEVIKKFRSWLLGAGDFGNKNATEERRKWILNNVLSLYGKTIACWCSPAKCHGDVLADFAFAEYVRKNNKHIKYHDPFKKLRDNE